MEHSETTTLAEVESVISRIPKPRPSSGDSEQVSPSSMKSRLRQPGFLQTAATGTKSAKQRPAQGAGSSSPNKLCSRKQSFSITAMSGRVSGSKEVPQLKLSPADSSSSRQHTSPPQEESQFIKAAWDSKASATKQQRRPQISPRVGASTELKARQSGAKQVSAEPQRQPITSDSQKKLTPLAVKSRRNLQPVAAVTDSTGDSPVTALRREFEASPNLGVEIGRFPFEDAGTTPENWLQPERPSPSLSDSSRAAWTMRLPLPCSDLPINHGTEQWIRDHCSVSSPDMLLPENAQSSPASHAAGKIARGKTGGLQASTSKRSTHPLWDALAKGKVSGASPRQLGEEGAAGILQKGHQSTMIEREESFNMGSQELQKLDSLQDTLSRLRVADESSEEFYTPKRMSSASGMSEENGFFSASSKLELNFGSPLSPVSHKIDLQEDGGE